MRSARVSAGGLVLRSPRNRIEHRLVKERRGLVFLLCVHTRRIQVALLLFDEVHRAAVAARAAFVGQRRRDARAQRLDQVKIRRPRGALQLAHLELFGAYAKGGVVALDVDHRDGLGAALAILGGQDVGRGARPVDERSKVVRTLHEYRLGSPFFS